MILSIRLSHVINLILKETLGFLVKRQKKNPKLLEKACKPLGETKKRLKSCRKSENSMKPDLIEKGNG
jgi:hypothetical protein